MKRKLAVILAADFEGYSRLMHADEEQTLTTLGAYRGIIDELIARHMGRIFNTAGDSVVAEFGSAVEAVRCGIAIQEELAPRNAELPDERKMRLRIGVNLGDVLVEGENLLGDGVNVAARLEGLADPGGICISGDVYNQIKYKLSVTFEDMGLQAVKNIREPVPAFRIVPGPVSVPQPRTEAAKSIFVAHWRTMVLAATLIVALTVGTVLVWQTVFAPQDPTPPQRRGMMRRMP